jgi:predicted Zn-dependent protease
MKETVLSTLDQLRAYARKQGLTAVFFYREEDSSLMRFANSAISLNTNEHLIAVEITVYDGNRRASYEVIASPGDREALFRGVDTAAEMVKHAMPLDYTPMISTLKADFSDESGYNAGLAGMSSQQKLEYFNAAAAGLETAELKLGGIFSSGVNVLAICSTLTDHSQYLCFTDAQVNVVLSHAVDKWEVLAEQSAARVTDLDPAPLQDHLSFLVEHYRQDPPVQLPLGKYDMIFGASATAHILHFMHWIGFNGGMMKRGYSFLNENEIGKQVLSPLVSLVDDTSDYRTFPLRQDLMGIDRGRYPIFEQGVFKAFTYLQDEADEFAQPATGHTVFHDSLTMAGGDHAVSSLRQLVALPRDTDLLYFPYLHYANIVNPSRGVFTGSSRFGALLLKKDGSISVPYNVRVSPGIKDLLGDQLAWLSRETEASNISLSYGARNPQAIVVPKFMRVNGVEITHSNSSY